MKIALLGYSGSGKSTLAAFLGKQKELPVLHLDTVQFIENWQEREPEAALEIVASFMTQASWVIDGNYTKFLQEKRLAEADQIVLLLFSPLATLRRVIQRRIKYHKKSRPDMAFGCEEKIDREFFWWVLYEGRRKARRQHFVAIQERYPEKVIVIKNQKQLDQFYLCHA
ncbi:P-loop NTPase family protein [Enterococcus sp. LJL98]